MAKVTILEQLLETLRAYAESPEGQNNKSLVSAMGSVIYRAFPLKTTMQAVEAITSAKQAPPGGKSSGWAVYSRKGLPVTEKKPMVPRVKEKAAAAAEPVEPEPVQPDPELEPLGGEPLTLDAFGINKTNYKEVLEMAPKDFLDNFGGRTNALTIATLLEVKTNSPNPKLVKDIQKALYEKFGEEDAATETEE